MSEPKTTETLEIPKHTHVEISVKNFGPIADATINLHPLTVFVGPSNTGKTYFSTLIYALHGTFNSFSQLPRRLGPFSSLSSTDIRAILRKQHTLDRPFKFSDLPQEIRTMLQSEIKAPESLKAELERCFDLNSITELIRLKGGQRDEMTVSLKVNEENQKLWNFNLKVSESNLTTQASINKNLVLYPKERFISKGQIAIEDLIFENLMFELSLELNRYTEDRAYLPAARSGIMQSHRVIASSLVERATRGGIKPFEVPTFSGTVADLMKQLILYEKSEEPDKEMQHLADALESDVLAGQILMKPTQSGYPEFLYRPHETGEGVRLTRAASMVSELAPVVLLLRSGIRPGVTLVIEEPEAHLHPGAQTDIALILAGLVRAGVRVVVTTHSDWLLKEIANLIRIGDLKRKGVPQVKKMESIHWLLPEEVGTWWFQKDGIVKHIPFDPTEGIEPKDYEDIAYKLYDRSVNLQDLLEKANRG